MKTKTEGKTRGLFTIMMAFMLIVTSAIVYNPKVVKGDTDDEVSSFLRYDSRMFPHRLSLQA